VPVWLQALSDDLLSEGGQALSSLTSPAATRPSGHKKGFFRPCFSMTKHIDTVVAGCARIGLLSAVFERYGLMVCLRLVCR